MTMRSIACALTAVVLLIVPAHGPAVQASFHDAPLSDEASQSGPLL